MGDTCKYDKRIMQQTEKDGRLLPPCTNASAHYLRAMSLRRTMVEGHLLEEVEKIRRFVDAVAREDSEAAR